MHARMCLFVLTMHRMSWLSTIPFHTHSTFDKTHTHIGQPKCMNVCACAYVLLYMCAPSFCKLWHQSSEAEGVCMPSKLQIIHFKCQVPPLCIRVPTHKPMQERLFALAIPHTSSPPSTSTSSLASTLHYVHQQELTKHKHCNYLKRIIRKSREMHTQKICSWRRKTVHFKIYKYSKIVQNKKTQFGIVGRVVESLKWYGVCSLTRHIPTSNHVYYVPAIESV